MTVYFTSDLHLGHATVALIRGFDSSAAHDAAIVASWDETVRTDDQVWVLGDVAVSSPGHALRLLGELPGEKHLIWGNHDQGHPMYRDSHRKGARYLSSGGGPFTSAQAFARRRISGTEVLLSHFPYSGDTQGRAEDRHRQYRLRDEGLPIIHGHTHGPSVVTEAAPRLHGGRGPRSTQIHVGLDAWGLRLVPLDEIAELIT